MLSHVLRLALMQRLSSSVNPSTGAENIRYDIVPQDNILLNIP